MPRGANHELPPGDYPLSRLGLQQAHFLGRFLQSEGFRGLILSSPYARTAETADAVAMECGLSFHLEPRLQEMRFYPEPPCPGMTIAELRANYPRVAPDATLAWPWLTPGGKEELDAVRARVDRFLAELLAAPPAEEILLIGHGASIQSLKWNLFARCSYDGPDHHNWNCSVSRFDITPKGIRMVDLARYDFMPQEVITSNKRLFGDPECV
jgi:broad specificity phosphatase PhoE